MSLGPNSYESGYESGVAEVVRLQNGQRRLVRILTNPATNPDLPPANYLTVWTIN
jgi:hypothetical protein